MVPIWLVGITGSIAAFVTAAWYRLGNSAGLVEVKEPSVLAYEEALANRLFGSWMVVIFVMMASAVLDTAGWAVVKWATLNATFATFEVAIVVVWLLGFTSRRAAARVFLITVTAFYLFRAHVSGAPSLLIWQMSPPSFFVVFGVVTAGPAWGLGSLLAFLIGSFVEQHLILPIEFPWVSVEFLDHYYSKPLPVIVCMFHFALAVHVAHDVALRASKLTELAAAKEDFIASISHEIRTPLNGIIGAIQLMDNLDDRNMLAENLMCARHSAMLLNMLVNNVILQRHSVVDIQSVDVRRFFKGLGSVLKVLSMYKPALRVDVTVRRRVPSCISVSASRLLQVLVNMGSNAIKFQDEKVITIVADVSEDWNELVVEVSDHGSGLSPEFVARGIFEKYHRDWTRTSRRGTGLGLYISRGLVEEMNGEIGFRPNKPRGSVFWIRIPLHREPVESVWSFMESGWGLEGDDSDMQKPAVPAVGAVAAGDCLVVDDTTVNQRVLVGFLHRLGYAHVDVADEGASGLQWLLDRAKRGSRSRAVVLLDVSMPVLDGPQMLATWRTLERQLKLPSAFIVVVTATPNPRGEELEGANGAMVKPVMLADLRRVLVDSL